MFLQGTILPDGLNWPTVGAAAILGVMIVGLLREWLREELVLLLSVDRT